ncbi:CD225/dispanin family protein [Lacinutrix sp. Hel_I_90]|uniref:CD225/dispanin family protein n=1 Tax=Lacinutrix sp. Hel_I_90 TaxID=1249999 RepID=UPI0005CA34AF|nr:CD225/dispanin family protein [Lacinutrix sp. Hel_I_90]
MEQIENTNKPPRPNSYLALAIISTILCCLPVGIVSIVYATKVNSAYEDGNYALAESASKNAKTWGLVSVGLAGLVFILWMVFAGFAILAGAANG